MLILALGVVCLVVGIWYANASPGTYQDDDLDRYYMARQVWSQPSLLIDRWGMPLALAVFAVPARTAGYFGVEVTTALITALAALLVALAARAAGMRFAWVGVVFFFFQPLTLELSYSALGEPVAALLVSAVLWLWYSGRIGWAIVLSGFLPLARIDAGVLTVVTLLAGWSRVGWGARLGALIPVVLWNGAGFLVSGEPLFVFGIGGDRPLNSLGPFTYLKNASVTVGAVVLFFAVWGSIRRIVPGLAPGKQPFPVFALVLGVVHGIVLGLLAWEVIPFGRSVGFLRHAMATAPAWALVAAWGMGDWLTGPVPRPVRALFAGLWTALVALFFSHQLIGHAIVGEGRVEMRWVVTLLLGVLGIVAVGRSSRLRAWMAGGVAVGACVLALVVVKPIPLGPEREAIQTAVDHLRQWQFETATVYTNHPWFVYFSDRDRYDKVLTPPLTLEALRDASVGDFVIWENHYGPRLWGDVQIDALRNDPRMERILELTAGTERNFQVVVFQVTG